MNWFNFIFISSHQPLLHIRQVALQFVVQIDLKSQNHGFIQKHEEGRHANEVSPVLAESFRSLWPECLLARGFRFSEPAVTIFCHLSLRIVIFWSIEFSIWNYFDISIWTSFFPLFWSFEFSIWYYFEISIQTSFSPFSRSNIVTIPFSCSFLSSWQQVRVRNH